MDFHFGHFVNWFLIHPVSVVLFPFLRGFCYFKHIRLTLNLSAIEYDGHHLSLSTSPGAHTHTLCHIQWIIISWKIHLFSIPLWMCWRINEKLFYEMNILALSSDWDLFACHGMPNNNSRKKNKRLWMFYFSICSVFLGYHGNFSTILFSFSLSLPRHVCVLCA